MISGVSPALSPAPSPSPAARGPRQAASDLRTLQASTETSAELTVVTEDGDRVTLSSHSRLEIGYSDYRYLSQSPGQQTALQASAALLSLSRDFEISVEGDLSAEERRDIRKLVKHLDKVVREFLQGDASGAAKRALALKDLGSLAGFDLAVEREQRVTTSETQQVSESSGVPAGHAEAPPALAPPGSARQPEGSPLADLVQRVVKALREATEAAAKLQALAPKLVNDLADGLHEDRTLEPHRSVLEELRGAVLGRLGEDGRREHPPAPESAPASA